MISTMVKSVSAGLAGGGTMDGDVTISGDLTVSGSATYTYDEAIAGKLVVGSTGDVAGSYAAGGDDLIIIGSGETGLTIAAGTSSNSNIFFAAGTTGNEAYRGSIQYDHATDDFAFGTDGANVKFKLDANSRISLSNNDSGGTGGSDSTSGNTTFGYLEGEDIASGGLENSLFGHGAGKNITTGDYNIAIGANS